MHLTPLLYDADELAAYARRGLGFDASLQRQLGEELYSAFSGYVIRLLSGEPVPAAEIESRGIRPSDVTRKASALWGRYLHDKAGHERFMRMPGSYTPGEVRSMARNLGVTIDVEAFAQAYGNFRRRRKGRWAPQRSG